MTEAEDKYPAIIEEIRQNLSLESGDESKDADIAKMPRKELFIRFLTWNGIIGYDSIIKMAIEEIYEVELKEEP
jgi:hypothetical protein